MSTENKFSADINLDCGEAKDFCHKYGSMHASGIARAFGFKGKGSIKAAQALKNYAWNKYTAEGLRKSGKIQVAQSYENICNRIYKEDIKGKIECW